MPCHYLYFCIYQHVNFDGNSLAMSACKLYDLNYYVFYDSTRGRWDDWAADASSWVNNQSGGAVAMMYAPWGGPYEASMVGRPT